MSLPLYFLSEGSDSAALVSIWHLATVNSPQLPFHGEVFFLCCFDSPNTDDTDRCFSTSFFLKKTLLFKKLNVFDSCKQRCSKIHLTQRLSPLMCFHSKLVNVSITVFKTAVGFCTGMKVGLRNVSNENNNLCFLMLERHYLKSLCSLWNHVMERKGLGRKSMENKTWTLGPALWNCNQKYWECSFDNEVSVS